MAGGGGISSYRGACLLHAGCDALYQMRMKISGSGNAKKAWHRQENSMA